MSKQITIPGLDEHDSEQRAHEQLKAGHYKEAIELYKKLWQESDDAKWRQQLAYCYLQRAISFADRGMIKEALVLWDNYIQYAEAPFEAYDQYIVWLIQVNNKPRLESALSQLSVKQIDKEYLQLASLLGFLMLTEYPEFQQYLPQESVFITHFTCVQAAMQACQTGEEEIVTASLKQLPYRSAFRDFRTLLNAILIAENSIECLVRLDKITADSPYSYVARLLFSCSLEGTELASELLSFSHKQRQLIANIKGFTKKQYDFVEQLVSQQGRLSDKSKLNLAIKFQALCGSKLTQHFCQATLATYPAGRRDFKKFFSAPNKFEENRVKALQLEKEGQGYDAEFYWQQCVNILKKEGAENDLKIALIFRHLAKQLPEGDDQAELIVDSLQYDPDDRESYLQVLVFYGRYQHSLNDYKQWLSRAIDKFPQDIEILTLAINTAVANKAFKKACQYAKKILTFDVLNTFAKDILFSSHLAHAKKLVKEKKYHLLDNEIKQAEKLNLGKTYAQKIQLMRGIACFVSQDKGQGLQLMTEALEKLNADPVNMHFQAAMEAQLSGLPVTTILKALPTTKQSVLSAQDLAKLIQQLKAYMVDDDQQILIHKALEKIKPTLKKSILAQDYDEELLISLCQILDDLNHFELLRYCVKLAWQERMTPFGVYYKIYSEVSGLPERLTKSHISSLEINREQAFESKDNRAMVLTDALLNAYYQMDSHSDFSFMDDLFDFGGGDENEMDEDPFEKLFDHIPENIFIKLDKNVGKLMKKTSPEQLVSELVKNTGQNQLELFSAMVADPDLFSALMLVKSAQSLEIDIQVDFDDVFQCFNVGSKTDSTPF